MEDYAECAKHTRNLEQKYTEFLVEQHQVLISQYKEQHMSNESAAKNDLEAKIEELGKELRNSENKWKALEKKNKSLEQEVQDLQKDSRAGNSKMPKSEHVKRLEEENAALKKQLSEKNTDYSAEELKRGQNDIMKKLSELNDHIKGGISTSGKDSGKKLNEELRRAKEKIKRLEDQLGAGNKTDSSKASMLEAEIERLRTREFLLQSNEKMLKKQKDTIVLLQNALSSKEKMLEQQKMLYEKLEKQKKTIFDDDMIKPASYGGSNENLNNTIFSKSTEPLEKSSKKTTKNSAKKPKINVSSKPEDEKAKDKMVSVENLIRNENKSFFSNLSFSNSSPMPESKFKRNY
ncbi:hypothetical protein ENBRE01_0508 [Enteropsectra breve]|nr:hypothetical protein ENBRE01_0508 [Enteropsectra breve]